MNNSISILHIADLHFGMENYGHTNPKTGLHTRLEDFSNSLKQAIDYAIINDQLLIASSKEGMEALINAALSAQVKASWESSVERVLASGNVSSVVMEGVTAGNLSQLLGITSGSARFIQASRSTAGATIVNGVLLPQ